MKTTLTQNRHSIVERLAQQLPMVCISLLCGNLTTFAQWSTVSTANNRVCFAPGNQIIPDAATDGAGGIIMAWADYRLGLTNVDVYAQRIDASGSTKWTLDGIPVTTTSGSQFLPVVATDGAGGAIIAWNQGSGVFAQRVDATGGFLWQTNGIAVLSGVQGQPNPRIVSDGSGGAIVVWTDYRNGFADKNIYAQRIDATGNTVWTTDGVALCVAADHQANPAIIGDGSGGAIVVWEDLRGTDTTDIYAQHIDASGVPQWTPNGVAIVTATGVQRSPVLARDGSGGAVIVWEDDRNAGTAPTFMPSVSAPQAQSSGRRMELWYAMRQTDSILPMSPRMDQAASLSHGKMFVQERGSMRSVSMRQGIRRGWRTE